MRDPLSRREFVTRGSRAALLVAAGPVLGRVIGQRSSGATDLARLASMVSGPVVGPRDSGYRQAKLLFNPSFDRARPRAVVFCRTPEDVVATVNFARRHGLRLAARSGGHSFGGYSAPNGGIVADVSRMSQIRIDGRGSTAVLGPGTLILDLNAGLGPRGLAIPVGTCPTVGVGGLTLGGGFGYSSRKLGLTADNLLELELVTASGDRLTCNADQNSDLFWACRGGGGGNFGITTSYRFRLNPVGQVALFTLNWHWSDGPAVVDAWQRWAPGAPDELFSTCSLSRAGGPHPTGPAVTSQGQYFGSPERLTSLLEPLLTAARPTRQRVTLASFTQAQQMWAACPPGHCRERAANPYTVKTDFFTEPIPSAGITTMTEALERWPGSSAASPTVGFELNSWGGAIGRVPSSATAFVHRGAQFLAIYGTTWSQHDRPALVNANGAWLEEFYADMRPYASGYAYQNLIDPQLSTWPHAYYGANLPRLIAVKRRYDPDGFFNFAQAIPLSPPASPGS
jgi:FAD/FMN-containing dehydrogenase